MSYVSTQRNPGELKNEWLAPELLYSSADANILRMYNETMEIKVGDFTKACSIVDTILNLLLQEMSAIAGDKFEGLQIRTTYIRQGSARQGLKVIAPDEFDVIMPFTIIGLHPSSIQAMDSYGKQVPGLIKLVLLESQDVVESRYPKLCRQGIFQRHTTNQVVMNVKELQKSVFNSILDKALVQLSSNPQLQQYTITRRVEPPTMKLNIVDRYDTLGHSVDVDLVPGMLVGEDNIKIPESGQYLTFPRYAVMKWVNRKDPTVPEHEKDYLWRVSSTAFERYMTDLCRGNRSRMYILTACMLLKTVFIEMKKKQNQVAVLYKSYYLKNICLYLILFLTIIGKKNVSGVREALGYSLKFIKLTLECKWLPNFFLGNPYLKYIFPQSFFVNEKPYNMFKKNKEDLLEHARNAFKAVESMFAGCYDNISDDESVMKFYRLIKKD